MQVGAIVGGDPRGVEQPVTGFPGDKRFPAPLITDGDGIGRVPMTEQDVKVHAHQQNLTQLECRWHSYTRAIQRLCQGRKETEPAPDMVDVLTEAELVYQWVTLGIVPAKPRGAMN